jgi:HSP20 family molecular chaperone IbpA
MESSYGSFERRLPVPEGVGEDDIVADYADGVLEITLPGAATPPEVEESKPAVRQIPIKTK